MSIGGQSSRGGKRANELLLPGEAKECLHRVQTPTGEELSPTTRTLRPRLNPAFVCWLMGWHWWWTHAEPINFGAAEMALYRSRLRLLLSSYCDE